MLSVAGLGPMASRIAPWQPNGYCPALALGTLLLTRDLGLL